MLYERCGSEYRSSDLRAVLPCVVVRLVCWLGARNHGTEKIACFSIAETRFHISLDAQECYWPKKAGKRAFLCMLLINFIYT